MSSSFRFQQRRIQLSQTILLRRTSYSSGVPLQALCSPLMRRATRSLRHISRNPKGAAATEDERREQRTTVEFFNQARLGVESIKGDPGDIIRRYRMPERVSNLSVSSSDAEESRRIDTYFTSEVEASHSGTSQKGGNNDAPPQSNPSRG